MTRYIPIHAIAAPLVYDQSWYDAGMDPTIWNWKHHGRHGTMLSATIQGEPVIIYVGEDPESFSHYYEMETPRGPMRVERGGETISLEEAATDFGESWVKYLAEMIALEEEPYEPTPEQEAREEHERWLREERMEHDEPPRRYRDEEEREHRRYRKLRELS